MADRARPPSKPSVGKRIALLLIDRAEARLGVALPHVREIADAGLGLLRRYNRIFGVLDPVDHLPAEAHAAARLRGALAAGCGDGVAAEIALARRAGLASATIDAILRADPDLPAPLPAVIRLSDAVVRDRTDDAEARAEVRRFHGQRGLIELSFAMNGAALLPGIRRAMGHATARDIPTMRPTPGGPS